MSYLIVFFCLLRRCDSFSRPGKTYSIKIIMQEFKQSKSFKLNLLNMI